MGVCHQRTTETEDRVWFSEVVGSGFVQKGHDVFSSLSEETESTGPTRVGEMVA